MYSFHLFYARLLGKERDNNAARYECLEARRGTTKYGSLVCLILVVATSELNTRRTMEIQAKSFLKPRFFLEEQSTDSSGTT